MSESKVKSSMKNNIQYIGLSERVTYDIIGTYKEEILAMIKSAEGYVLDLSQVTQIDSTGMGLIVNLARHFIQNKSKIVLVISDPLIMELFHVSKLDTVFTIVDNVFKAEKIVLEEDESYFERLNKY